MRTIHKAFILRLCGGPHCTLLSIQCDAGWPLDKRNSKDTLEKSTLYISPFYAAGGILSRGVEERQIHDDEVEQSTTSPRFVVNVSNITVTSRIEVNRWNCVRKRKAP